jgi:hypothetical protein
MAAKTFYLLNTIATGPNWFGSTQDGGSAPAAANSTFGFQPSNVSLTSGPYYWCSNAGATALTTNFSNIAYLFTGYPQKGTSSGTGPQPGGSGDSFLSPVPYSGNFSAGNWVFNFGMRTTVPTAVGHMRVTVWAVSNPSSAAATARNLVGSILACSNITLSAAGVTQISTVTWNAPAITLNNEYLAFGVDWNETTAGTAATTNVIYYQSASTIATPNFSPFDLLAGDLAPSVTFAADLIVGSPVDLAGDLAPGASFAADFIVGSPVDLAGNLAPVTSFAADASILVALAGDLAPSVGFAGALDSGPTVLLAGDMSPQVTFAAEMAQDLLFAGDLAAQVTFAGQFTAGPLWTEEAAPIPPWTSSEPCPPPLWTAEAPCPPPPWNSSESPPSSLWTPHEPCDPADWEESELCNG